MSDESELNVFRCLDFIRDHAAQLAQAKANRVHLEEFRKSKKALLMKAAEVNGATSVNAQERDAYAHPEYQELLSALRASVEEEERLRWMMVGAQAKISVFQTIEATRRIEIKSV
jgi:hypothetical protein